uniref:SMB domain-containing protein n=1 Tax=Apteryx owenii TaxID=8824 RepID=A0A8B9QEF2_APTOW
MSYLKAAILWNVLCVSLLILLVALVQEGSSQDLSSCAGRCGEGFSRENDCQCDYSCQHFEECCPDFGKVCAPALSCRGRCFEAFERGRACDCDADCERYQKCCPDYADHCKEGKKPNKKETTTKKPTAEPHLTEHGGGGLMAYFLFKKKIKLNPHYFVAHIKEEKNLCNGKPADGMVALQNGTLAVFRGHYYWLLNGRSPPTAEPRRITDGWGIPSPIDTVFSRCNCDGKTFFIKNSLYWRFTDGVMDKGYPKALARGFAGLSGKIIAALPVARHNNRPESVYFIKKGGKIQQYVYKQEPAKKCKNKARLTIKYPAYVPRLVIRRRFQRAVRLQAFQTVRINPYPSEILRKEVKITAYWRGLPKVIHSTVSVPNYNKPDGYDYYAFSSNRYYSLDVGSKTATSVTYLTGKTVSKDWYNCPK